MTLKENSNATLSFILRNEELKQEMRRNIRLPGRENKSQNSVKFTVNTGRMAL